MAEHERRAGHELRLLAVQRRASQPQPRMMNNGAVIFSFSFPDIELLRRELCGSARNLVQRERPFIRVRHRELVHGHGATRSQRQRRA